MHRQERAERAAAAYGAPHLDAAAVRFDDALGKREPEADSARPA
jgi:hypothetical protein